MPGNILGGLKGSLTRRYKRDLSEWSEIEREQIQREIRSNKAVWNATWMYLREIDPFFAPFWDNKVPNRLYWTGDKFQAQLKILWDRISQVKNNNL